MARHDPERLELSTRDRVALANFTEIAEGRGTAKGGVLLDVSHLPREQVLERLPRVYRMMLDLQMLDITTTPMEVAPTAHYSMGGVRVAAADHATDVEGLYVIGEAASGLHGANRLGGNSLIELLVYGRLTGAAAADFAVGSDAPRRDRDAVAEAAHEVDLALGLGTAVGSEPAAQENARRLQRAVRDVMTEHAGGVRSADGLTAGRRRRRPRGGCSAPCAASWPGRRAWSGPRTGSRRVCGSSARSRTGRGPSSRTRTSPGTTPSRTCSTSRGPCSRRARRSTRRSR